MKKFLSLTAIILMIVALSSCSKNNRITRQTFAFDTVINITAFEKDSPKIEDAIKLCRNYEKIFSRTDAKSELFSINEKGASPVSDDIKEVLAFSLQMSEYTQGAFDITVAPLVELWNVAERTSPPDDSEILKALSHVGYNGVNLNPFDITGKKLDMGAVAKGYIADRLIEEFKKSSTENVIVDLGGNVALIGQFTVGIRDPFNPEEIFGTISLKDKSAVTSGAYQRYFEHEGKRYHHIIDPRTGYPSDSGIASVTVISPSSMQADALSTAIFILGKDSISLCSKFTGTDALIIMEDGSTLTTENFAKKYSLRLN